MNIPVEQFFKVLGDLTRLRLLVLIGEQGELCVCELTHALDEIQPKISRHLALLREAHVVLDRRHGQWVYYRVNPGLPGWAQAALDASIKGILTQPPFADDLQRLLSMPDRPAGACCE